MKEYIYRQFLDNILSHLGIPESSLFSKTQERGMVEARQLLYYLCKKKGMRLSEIKLYMEKDGFYIKQQTIGHGVKKVQNTISNDPDYRVIISKLNQIDI